jgi:hypothetical protein
MTDTVAQIAKTAFILHVKGKHTSGLSAGSYRLGLGMGRNPKSRLRMCFGSAATPDRRVERRERPVVRAVGRGREEGPHVGGVSEMGLEVVEAVEVRLIGPDEDGGGHGSPAFPGADVRSAAVFAGWKSSCAGARALGSDSSCEMEGGCCNAISIGCGRSPRTGQAQRDSRPVIKQSSRPVVDDAVAQSQRRATT